MNMTNLKNLLGDIAGKVKSKLGVDATDLQAMEKAEREATERLADIESRLDAVRAEAKRAEAGILYLNEKYKKATGIEKKMLGKELDLKVRQIQPIERRHELLLENHGAQHTLVSKVGEVKVLLGRVNEGEIDDVAVRLEEAIDAAGSAEQALKGLTGLTLRTGETGRESSGEDAAPPRTLAQSAPGLGEDTERFLRQFESEQG